MNALTSINPKARYRSSPDDQAAGPCSKPGTVALDGVVSSPHRMHQRPHHPKAGHDRGGNPVPRALPQHQHRDNSYPGPKTQGKARPPRFTPQQPRCRPDSHEEPGEHRQLVPPTTLGKAPANPPSGSAVLLQSQMDSTPHPPEQRTRTRTTDHCPPPLVDHPPDATTQIQHPATQRVFRVLLHSVAQIET